MKAEIKEILDNFKIYEDRYKKCNETQFIIFYRDIHLLLDYITTLQEENEKLKRENNLLKSDIEASQEIISDYIKENERLNNIIKEIRKLADKYEMGKYDYNVPSFEIREILDKENKQ